MIGRQGANISHIRSKSGAELRISKQNLAIDHRDVTITGTQANVDAAVEMVHSSIERENLRVSSASYDRKGLNIETIVDSVKTATLEVSEE